MVRVRAYALFSIPRTLCCTSVKRASRNPRNGKIVDADPGLREKSNLDRFGWLAFLINNRRTC